MACLLSAADCVSSERVKVGGGDNGGSSVYFLCCENVWWKVSAKRPGIRNLCKNFLFVLNSHEYTVHLIAALQCRPTKANKGSRLICSDIYFNIDNVVSSRPFFSSSSRTQEALGWMSEMKGVRVSELAFMSYFSMASPAKEMCILTKNKLPPPPEGSLDGFGPV